MPAAVSLEATSKLTRLDTVRGAIDTIEQYCENGRYKQRQYGRNQEAEDPYYWPRWLDAVFVS
jgi:hypothetical protein